MPFEFILQTQIESLIESEDMREEIENMPLQNLEMRLMLNNAIALRSRDEAEKQYEASERKRKKG